MNSLKLFFEIIKFLAIMAALILASGLMSGTGGSLSNPIDWIVGFLGAAIFDGLLWLIYRKHKSPAETN